MAVQTVDDLLKEGSIMLGNDPRLEVHRIPIGVPTFDKMIGGGLPQGRCILSYGPESTGKTLLAQICVKAVQASDRPQALYMDMERSFDKEWWEQSGVDTDKLMVSAPATAEQATDIMRSVLTGMDDLGILIVDSLAAMTPQEEADPAKSAENRTIGSVARVVTGMYIRILPLLGKTIFMATNQMRETIGWDEELAALPGGRAQRHYSHVILRTRRESWITDAKGQRIGYHMEIITRKNKVATPAPSIVLPILFHGQLDLLTSYLDTAIERRLVTRKGPYYYWGQNSQGYLGLAALRKYFMDNPAAQKQLETELGV